MARDSLAKLVYGRRDPSPHDVTSSDELTLVEGRKPRSSKLRVRKLGARCSTCTRPLPDDYEKKRCEGCIATSRRRPRHADSIQEVRFYNDKNSRSTFYRSKGRLA